MYLYEWHRFPHWHALRSYIFFQRMSADRLHAARKTRSVPGSCTVQMAEVSLGNVEVKLFLENLTSSFSEAGLAHVHTLPFLHQLFSHATSVMWTHPVQPFTVVKIWQLKAYNIPSWRCASKHHQYFHPCIEHANILVGSFVGSEARASFVIYRFSDCYKILAVSFSCFFRHTRTTSTTMALHSCSLLPLFRKIFAIIRVASLSITLIRLAEM